MASLRSDLTKATDNRWHRYVLNLGHPVASLRCVHYLPELREGQGQDVSRGVHSATFRSLPVSGQCTAGHRGHWTGEGGVLLIAFHLTGQ